MTAVLVTRPEPEASRLAERLRGEGYAVVVAPLLRIVAVAGAPIPDRAYAAVLVASGNALRAVEGSPALPRLARLPLVAVGDRTAARARALGFADVVEAAGDASALVGSAAARFSPAAGPLLHLAGEERTGTVEQGLGARGFEVDVIEVYRAVAAQALSREAQEALGGGGIGAALFSSRRIAETFAALVRGAGLADRLGAVLAVCAAARVAGGLDGLNFAAVVVPDRPTEGAMIEALAHGRAGGVI